MDFFVADFNGADELFAGTSGSGSDWDQVESCVRKLPLYLQASDQRNRNHAPIFDPKATNADLTASAANLGWHPIPVPPSLQEFGNDWDAGKNSTLCEWQFSNYPFLWNNVIRTEAVIKGDLPLPTMQAVEGLIVVTKSGMLPASNSTLYFEQARAQLDVVTKFGAFDVPIRLVGLALPEGATSIGAVWSEYSGRYVRAPSSQRNIDARINWGERPQKYGNIRASFTLP